MMVSESVCEVKRVARGLRRIRPKGGNVGCGEVPSKNRERDRGFRRLAKNSANKSVGNGTLNAVRRRP
jgi:hypothetical protein